MPAILTSCWTSIPFKNDMWQKQLTTRESLINTKSLHSTCCETTIERDSASFNRKVLSVGHNTRINIPLIYNTNCTKGFHLSELYSISEIAGSICNWRGTKLGSKGSAFEGSDSFGLKTNPQRNKNKFLP